MPSWHNFIGGVHVAGDHTGITGAVANALVDAKGDIVTATANDVPARLAVGSNGQFLTAQSAQATGLLWATHDGTGDPHTQYVENALVDAKGDVITATADNTPARLAVGSNKFALHGDTAEATGLKWQLPGGKDTIAGFRRENLAATLTASQLERSISATLDAALPVVMTHAGSIIGISVASTEARTAGTATFEVFKNGTGTGLTCVLDGTNTQYAFAVQTIDLDTFAAGDRLDIRVTTTGTWTPITADVEALLTVQYDPA